MTSQDESNSDRDRSADGDRSDRFTLKQTSEVFSKKFKTRAMKYDVSIRPFEGDSFPEAPQYLYTVFGSIFATVMDHIAEQDFVRIVINQYGLATGFI